MSEAVPHGEPPGAGGLRRLSLEPHVRPARRSAADAPRRVRADSRVGRWIRAALGVRRVVSAEGVLYRERDASCAKAALRGLGRGEKSFDAVFEGQPAMRIRLTPRRVYHDLAPDPLVETLRRIAPLLPPAARAAFGGCGTGAAAAWLADHVGPSGAVLGMDRDGESVRFARRRYARANLGFEVCGPETLAQETDHAFDLVVVTDRWLAGIDPPSGVTPLPAAEHHGPAPIDLAQTDPAQTDHAQTDRAATGERLGPLCNMLRAAWRVAAERAPIVLICAETPLEGAAAAMSSLLRSPDAPGTMLERRPADDEACALVIARRLPAPAETEGRPRPTRAGPDWLSALHDDDDEDDEDPNERDDPDDSDDPDDASETGQADDDGDGDDDTPP